MALVASTLRAAPEEREVRTAMIGIGHRGTTLLGQVLKQERVRITAMCSAPTLRQQLLHHISMHIGQSEVAALETIGQLGMVET